jgi:predicted TIM-barrel fold metal-dependent hydrolase
MMDPKEFTATAEKVLSNDPYSRLTQKTKELVNNPDCIFDTHAHIFDRRCIKIDYFLLRLVLSPFKRIVQRHLQRRSSAPPSRVASVFLSDNPSALIYERIENRTFLEDNEEEWNDMEVLLEELEKDDSANRESESLAAGTLSNLLEAFKVLLKGRMEEVLKLYQRKHALMALEKYRNRPFISVILMMDLEQGWGRQTKKSYRIQVSELNAIAENYSVLPFLALDPRRDDLYETFLQAFCEPNSKFFGVKLYPSFGYAPSDKWLHPIYYLCEKYKIPVTTHCGGTVISTFHSPVVIHNCSDFDTCTSTTIKGTRVEIARQLNEPTQWELVLQSFPKLKLNLGHFGGGDGWADYNNTGSTAGRIDTIRNLMDCENVYADFSFNISDKNLDDAFLKALQNTPKFQERAMFGTDYWVVLPSTNLADSTARFLNHVQAFEEILITSNPKSFLFG